MFCTLTFCAVVAFISCNQSADGGSDGTETTTTTEEEEKKDTLLYYDEDKEIFFGSVTYDATTTETKLLVNGFLENAVWSVTPPDGAEIWTGWRKNHTYASILHQAERDVLYVALNVPANDADVLKWADIPGTTVTVTLKFTTGASLTLGTQTGYTGWEGDFSTTIDDYIYLNKYEKQRQLLPFVGNVKVKKAIAYLNSGNRHTATVDWTDSTLIKKYSFDTDDYYSKYAISFEPELSSTISVVEDEYGNTITSNIEKLVITTLSGKEITCTTE